MTGRQYSGAYMKKTEYTTLILITMVTSVLIAWDIYVASNDVDGDTISEIFHLTAMKYALLPMAWGVLGGHFFAPKRKRVYRFMRLFGLLLVTLSTIAYDIAQFSGHVGPMNPMLVFVTSIFIGAVLWPQTAKE